MFPIRILKQTLLLSISRLFSWELQSYDILHIISKWHTDGSSAGLEAILTQWSPGAPMEHAVAYASQMPKKLEKNYSTTEEEYPAIVWPIVKFWPYLYGCHFTAVTDHHALCWLASLEGASSCLRHWVLCRQEFNFIVQYKPWKRHHNVDVLSHCSLSVDGSNASLIWRQCACQRESMRQGK